MVRRLTSAGDLWIIAAALLWATDALVRVKTLEALDPAFIVWIEHLVILVSLAPFLLVRARRKELGTLTHREMALAALIGAGGSAIATVFFTRSFQYLNPSVAVLLQKLQPVAVILLARFWLKEHPPQKFYPWALLALLAAIALGWSEESLDSPYRGMEGKGTFFAMSAALLWAIATVAGRRLLVERPLFAVTFWRFFWGTVALAIFLPLTQSGVALTHQTQLLLTANAEVVGALVFMGVGPGLLAILAYYRGLTTAPASRVTILELIFPICAVLLNRFVLGTHLSLWQWASGIVLVWAVVQIHRLEENGRRK